MTPHKTAIVTGAGSGIGRQTSIQLAAAGYHLVLVSRTRDQLEETADLAADATSLSVQCDVTPTDLCDPVATRSLVEKTIDRFGRIDAIANVAGYSPLQPIEETSIEEWESVIDTNLSCVVHLTAEAWPILRKQGGGVIVNVSSMASIDPFPGLSIYAAAKAGLNMFTKCTAREGEPHGIRAVGIAPGAVETPMLRSLFDLDAIPHERTLDPKDVARTIRDCITGNRQFESGETILMPSP